MIPISRGWYREVVLGGRQTTVTPSASSLQCDGALFMTKNTGSLVTRRTSRTNTEVNQSAIVGPSIQEFVWLK